MAAIAALAADAAGCAAGGSPPPRLGRDSSPACRCCCCRSRRWSILLARRLEWILVGAPGLPPLRLPAEGTPFGSVAVPPFVIWPAWALAGPHRAGLAATDRAHRPGGGGHPDDDPLRLALGLAGDRRRRRHRRRPVRVAPSSPAASLPASTWQALARGGRRARGRCAGRGSSRPAPHGDHVAPLPRRAVARHPGRLADGSAPGHRARLHAVRPPGGGAPTSPSRSASPTRTTCRSACSATPASSGWPWRRSSWSPCSSWRARGGAARRSDALPASCCSASASAGCSTTSPSSPGFDLLAITLIAVALLDAGAVDWARPSWGRRGRWLPATLAAVAGGAVLLAAMVTADAGGIAYRAGIRSAVDGELGGVHLAG